MTKLPFFPEIPLDVCLLTLWRPGAPIWCMLWKVNIKVHNGRYGRQIRRWPVTSGMKLVQSYEMITDLAFLLAIYCVRKANNLEAVRENFIGLYFFTFHALVLCEQNFPESQYSLTSSMLWVHILRTEGNTRYWMVSRAALSWFTFICW